MTRHEISQLKVKDKVVVQTGLYAGYVGEIEHVDLSAAFPNGSVQVKVDGALVKFSGVEILRFNGEEEFKEASLDLGDVGKDGWEFEFDETEIEDDFTNDPLEEEELNA